MDKKNINVTIAAIAAMLIAGSVFSSCKKIDDDPSETYPAAAFTLSAVEDRYTYFNFPWTISKTGVTDSVNEDIDKMYVTKYNTLTLEVKGTGAGFQGVNVKSSNAEAVRVTQLDANHYDLSYLKDGEADISVWNGGKKDEVRTTFHVTAKEAIYPTAAVFVLDEGTENEQIVKATEWFIDEKDNFFRYYDGLINVHKPLDYRSLYANNAEGFQIFIDPKEGEEEFPGIIHTVRFKTIEPENTSFRTMGFNATMYRSFMISPIDKDWKDYLETNNLKTWKEYLETNGFTTNWWDIWTGDFKDFEKTCYISKKTPLWSNGFSLCELSFRAGTPAGSPWCQTAIFVHLQPGR